MTDYSADKLLLILLHKLYAKFFGEHNLLRLQRETDNSKASAIIYNELIAEKPSMLSRFGAVEISALANYVSVKNKKHNIWKYIKGEQHEWWWNEGIRRCMTDNAGFFPNTYENLSKFGDLMLEDMKQIDVLASWQPDEIRFAHLFPEAKFIDYTSFDCFWTDKPWTAALENKTVLVVHPFAQEIEYQYSNNRLNLFINPAILPSFNLITFKSVQSIGGNNEFASWFDALDFMKSQIDEIEYDICLLGCGAYGMPLAAHIKRKSKKAVHIGGSLQLFFGVKGKRWEDPMYAFDVHKEKGKYASLFNEYWIRPGQAAQIKNAEKVDSSAYW